MSTSEVVSIRQAQPGALHVEAAHGHGAELHKSDPKAGQVPWGDFYVFIVVMIIIIFIIIFIIIY